ncbi:hypothetical protein YC2023_015040 [Brassica napus]
MKSSQFLLTVLFFPDQPLKHSACPLQSREPRFNSESLIWDEIRRYVSTFAPAT